jgi:hypothetical protein
MSSNYSYKGISVSQICSNNGNTNVSGYTGMPATTYTNYSGLRPLTFGYTSGSTDICNQYTAPNTGVITTSQTINILSNAKSCRVISVGGAGGGGAHGAKATAYTYNGHDEQDYGGDGGRGGYGKYTYNNYISLSGYNTISVTVGNGGTGGETTTDPDSKKSSYISGSVPIAYNKVNVYGGAGGAGKAGNSSYILLNGTNTPIALADGGNGGGGGNGGYAWAGQSSHDGSKGTPGSPGNSTTSTSNDGNYPVLSNYGTPSNTISVDGEGTGGGYSGTQGVVQIIWLYD